MSVGVSGLEPEKAGPESAVLPLHHTPICLSVARLYLSLSRSESLHFLIASAKLRRFSESSKLFRRFFNKNVHFSSSSPYQQPILHKKTPKTGRGMPRFK